MAFAKKRSCLIDGWFKFDSALVFLMVFETWITPMMGGGAGGGMGDASMLRLLRLLRLTRMARLMRSVPELLTMLKGMAAAARSVLSTLVLLILFTYIFAIIFKQQTAGDEELEYYFGMIPEAMWNLLLGGCLLDNITDHLNLLRERNPVMCAVFLLWVLLSAFTILNMLIGVLCEVVSAVSEAEKEKMVVSFAKSKFLSVLERIDKDGSGAISEKEFDTFVMDEGVRAPLEDLEVDRENLKSLADVIFSANEKKEPSKSPAADSPPGQLSRKNSLKSVGMDQERELKFGELLEMILDLRASNPAMVSHIVELRKHLRANQMELKEFFEEVDSDVEEVKDHQHQLDHDIKQHFDMQEQKMEQMVSQMTARQDDIMQRMIMPLMVGVRELQQKFECSNFLPVPNRPGVSSMHSEAHDLSNGEILKESNPPECTGAGNLTVAGSSTSPILQKNSDVITSPQGSLRQAAIVDECNIHMEFSPDGSQKDGQESIAAEDDVKSMVTKVPVRASQGKKSKGMKSGHTLSNGSH
eukprot:gnl/MRDRNA2_/MRDRNA2_65241_c0_seq1.p1 gnl/MRDRNA2_/MRDRNA2_65241_c0~~gnl/MRDRNA2_/MRDRNA2_65241_c0_seq1.p1  ORF type:complete len:587 (+),score=130.98 gnl/MRDRNA2_/MRDRNA2_65241_c0_seq1:181-1761(+)